MNENKKDKSEIHLHSFITVYLEVQMDSKRNIQIGNSNIFLDPFYFILPITMINMKFYIVFFN